jgi:hypothetical protein
MLVVALVVGGAAAGGGFVAAQTPQGATAPKAAPKTAPKATHEGMSHGGGHDRMGGGMGPMCPMMGGGGGMGMGGGMPMGGMVMMDPDTRVEVKNVDKGVTITLTSTDAAKATRLQKMAEAMRLMHEAMTQ